MALSERKQLRQLRTTVRELNRDLMALHLKPTPEDQLQKLEYLKRFNSLHDEYWGQVKLLGEYETRYLTRTAQSWGIEVPSFLDKREWYIGKYGDADFQHETYLNEIGKAAITKKIRDARFAYWKGWAEILIPILSLVIAIIALLK